VLKLQAAIEEADVRLHEATKAELDFTRDVANGPTHPVWLFSLSLSIRRYAHVDKQRTGKLSAERLCAHIEARIKVCAKCSFLMLFMAY
jgi:hypothetical protein